MADRATERRPPRLRRWGAWAAAVLTLAAGLVATMLSCTATVRPRTDVAEPQTVFLLDHGRTASLVVPAAEDDLVRYAYGDWRYYALRETGALSGLRALVFPTQGALGRHELEEPATEAGVRDAVRVGIEHLYPLRVERSEAAALRARLDALFQRNINTAVWNAGSHLRFVHHPQDYSAWDNSNHVVADWLREMGVTVEGTTFYSRWDVEREARED